MNISAIYRFCSTHIPYTNKYVYLLVIVLILSLSAVEAVKAQSTTTQSPSQNPLSQQIRVGQAIDLPLTSGNQENVFAIFTEQTRPKARGAVILLHGLNSHPNWQDIIHPLRTGLPDKGWTTLSIQLPKIESYPVSNEAHNKILEDSVAYIEAAMTFIKGKNYRNIVLLGHDFGSLMALNYMQTKLKPKSPKAPFDGAILISTPSLGDTIPLNSPAMIGQVNLPILDIFGSDDKYSVLNYAPARKTAAYKVRNKHFRQVEMIGADHFFTGLNQELLRYISGWLTKKILKIR